jgi:hypothetical protein
MLEEEVGGASASTGCEKRLTDAFPLLLDRTSVTDTVVFSESSHSLTTTPSELSKRMVGLTSVSSC